MKIRFQGVLRSSREVMKRPRGNYRVPKTNNRGIQESQGISGYQGDPGESRDFKDVKRDP